MNTLISTILLAQAYGSGAYGSGTYGGSVIHIGPFTLPDTGAGMWAIIFALIIALAVGLYVWSRNHRAKRLAAKQTTATPES